MPRPKLTPEERHARKKANALRYYYKNHEAQKAATLTRYHARLAEMTPDELEAFRARQNATNHRLRADPTPERLAKKRLRDSLYHHANRETLLPQMSARHQMRLQAMTPEEAEAFRLDKNAAQQRFYATNKEKIAKRKTIRSVKAAQRQLVIDAAHGVCVYCPAYNPGCQLCRKGTHKLTVDHITAIVNGGDSSLHNLIACCRSCNAKKRASKHPIPVQPLLL